jgi:hypothetical protein
MKALFLFRSLLASFFLLGLFVTSAFANTFVIILPYDPAAHGDADVRGDPEWVEYGQILEDYKELTGLETRVVTLEEVKRRFDGADDAEKVKRAIHDFVRHQDTRYVMLVGDTGIFPIRQQFVGHSASGVAHPDGKLTYRFFPTDAYFGNLWAEDASPDVFDSWNANGDFLYGEMYTDSLNGVDNFSYLPDVAIGRVPARTPEEFLRYVVKVMRYETRMGALAGNQAALLTAGSWNGARASIDDLASLLDDDYQISRLWKDTPQHLFAGEFGGGSTATPDVYISNFINSNLPQAVKYSGHGTAGNWNGVGFSSADAIALTNALGPSIVTAIGCETAQFAARDSWQMTKPATAPTDTNQNSMAEAFLTQGRGGAVAYVGASIKLYPIAHSLDSAFYSALIDPEIERVGDAYVRAINQYIEINDLDELPATGSTKNISPAVGQMLFGDPSLRIRGVSHSLTPPSTRADYDRWVNADDRDAGPEHVHDVTFYAHDEDTRVVATNWQAQSIPAGPWSAENEGSVAAIEIDLSPISEGDELLFRYYSVDQEGNTESPNTDRIGFDYTPPVTTAYVDGERYHVGESDSIPLRNASVVLNAEDALSGPHHIEYMFGNGIEGSWYSGDRLTLDISAISPCTVGSQELRFRAVDRAGNREAWQSVPLEIAPLPFAAQELFCFEEWTFERPPFVPPTFRNALPVLNFFEDAVAPETVGAVRFDIDGPVMTMDQAGKPPVDWQPMGMAQKRDGVWSATWNGLKSDPVAGFFRVRAVPRIQDAFKATDAFWIYVNDLRIRGAYSLSVDTKTVVKPGGKAQVTVTFKNNSLGMMRDAVLGLVIGDDVLADTRPDTYVRKRARLAPGKEWSEQFIVALRPDAMPGAFRIAPFVKSSRYVYLDGAPVMLTMAPGNCMYSARILDDRGRPIEATLIAENAARKHTASSNSLGEYRFDSLEPGQYRIAPAGLPEGARVINGQSAMKFDCRGEPGGRTFLVSRDDRAPPTLVVDTGFSEIATGGGLTGIVFDNLYGRGVKSVQVTVRDLVTGRNLGLDGEWLTKPHSFKAEITDRPMGSNHRLLDQYRHQGAKEWVLKPEFIEELDPTRHIVHIVATDAAGNRTTTVLEGLGDLEFALQ